MILANIVGRGLCSRLESTHALTSSPIRAGSTLLAIIPMKVAEISEPVFITLMPARRKCQRIPRMTRLKREARMLAPTDTQPTRLMPLSMAS